MDPTLKAYLEREFKKLHEAINQLTPTKKPKPELIDAEDEVPRLVEWHDE